MIARVLVALALLLAAPDGSATAQERPAEALFAQGQQFETGTGVVQNYARAAELYARAAEAGHADAAHRLGLLTFQGLGVTQDPARARALLEEAARDGAPQHLLDLGLVLESSGAETEAAALYDQAAEAGSIEAAVSLAVLLQAGRGVPQDTARALQIYTKAARAGDARAQNNLGLMYLEGVGVDRNETRAAELIAAAAEQGLRQALTNLGMLYENGFGLPQDDARAAELYRLGGVGIATPEADTLAWDDRLLPPARDDASVTQLLRAAQAGDPVAAFLLGWLILEDADSDPRRAAQLMRQAAEAGLGPAMTNLGMLYMQGRGVPQDYVQGLEWLTLAASLGHGAARARVGHWQQRMTPDQITTAQTRAQTRAETRWQALTPGISRTER